HLFNDLGLEPDIAHIGTVTRYSAPAIDILVGDIFDVSADCLGPVSAIVDRAALVALPENMRTRYTSHLINLTDAAPQLLITYQYDQALVAGPPFSVTDAEVKRHYGATYHLTPLESQAVAGGLKGAIAATETVWLLQKAHK
ncbi:MAG: thiopurine S-methyltransferase, partial [Methylovulum sp.]|nr:thiopurine S-methyltransferase [Methylovulum sp.]